MLDLDGVSFIDAVGIGALIHATTRVAKAHGTLHVTHHSGLMMLLKLTGETHRVKVTHDRGYA